MQFKMNDLERYCLRKANDLIFEDLEPKYLLDDLVDERVLTIKEKESILQQNSEKGQIVKLLGILPDKSGDTFNLFIKTLEKDDRYPWIAEKLRECFKISKDVDAKIDQNLQRGGVPFQVTNYIVREETLSTIKDALRNMCLNYNHDCVVLHGMVGCGKTVLAAEVLRDRELFTECFQDGVYWICLGNIKADSEDINSSVLSKMHIQIDRMQPSNNNFPPTVELALSKLRQLFAEIKSKKVLLILDDVWVQEAVEAFDVGCPILITTRDHSMIDVTKINVHTIEIPQGMSLDESKQLLALWSNMNVESLPVEAEDVHNRYTGLPVLMATIGASLREQGNRPERWKQFSNRKQRVRSRRISAQAHAAVVMAYKHLDPELQSFLAAFAIFVDDINIPVQVFEILWGMDKIEVLEIMHELKAKSWVKIQEDTTRNIIEFGIHDLYMEALKKEHRDTSALHRTLIENYLSKYDYTKLPSDDTYIHYYIGHHLHGAGMGDLLQEIYLNLNFVENKIKITGPSDLVSDYLRYKTNFTSSQKEVAEFLAFIQPNIHILSNSEVDVVQLALAQPHSSSVFQKAKLLALKEKDKLYFEWGNTNNCFQATIKTQLHIGGANFATFSPNSLLVASGGEDCFVKLWSRESGVQVASYKGHQKQVTCVAFSPSGEYLASTSADSFLYVWKTEKYCNSDDWRERRPSSGCVPVHKEYTDKVYSYEHCLAATYCAFSPSGKFLVSADEKGGVVVHDVANTQVFKTLPSQPDPVTCCCFTRDEKYVVFALGNSSGSICMWDFTLPDLLYKSITSHHYSVTGCCTTPDGRHVVSSAGNYIWKWSLVNWELIKKYNTMKKPYYLTCCAVSPDGALIAGGTTERSIILWNYDNGNVLGTFKGDSEDVKSVTFSNDSAHLISASSDGTVMVWNTQDCKILSKVYLIPLISVRFTEENPVIAAVDECQTVKLFTGFDGHVKVVHKLEDEEEEIKVCNLSIDCKDVVLGTKTGKVYKYIIDEKVLKHLGFHNDEVTSIDRYTDKIATSSRDHTIKVFGGHDKTTLLVGHNDAVVQCHFFDEGRKILSCSEDGKMIVWDVESGKQLTFMAGHANQKINSCCVSPDKLLYLSGSSDRTICLWNASNGQPIKSEEFSDCVRCCKFSPDGKLIAVGDDSGNISVCNVQNGSKIKLGSHGTWVHDLEFSSSGAHLVTASDTIKWWSVDDAKLLQTFHIRGTFTRSIFASPDFTTFVTVDENGVLYILKQLK